MSLAGFHPSRERSSWERSTCEAYCQNPGFLLRSDRSINNSRCGAIHNDNISCFNGGAGRAIEIVEQLAAACWLKLPIPAGHPAQPGPEAIGASGGHFDVTSACPGPRTAMPTSALCRVRYDTTSGVRVLGKATRHSQRDEGLAIRVPVAWSSQCECLKAGLFGI